MLYGLFILNSLCGAFLAAIFGLPMVSVEDAVWGSTVPLLMLFVQVPPVILLALPPTNRWFRSQRRVTGH